MPTPDDSSHDLDEILAHRAWVAGLARSLLFDQAQVDDVVQETWLVALKSRPRDPGSTRAWLGGVVRNLVGRQVRGESRRRRREMAAAVPDDTLDASTGAGVDDVVAQTELHRTVVEAVLALDEPYRTTVLRRYFRGLSAVEIARREQVPASTVRNRLRRAMEQLRTRLDDSAAGTRGEARRAWMLALVPLAVAPEVSAVVAGTTLGVGTGVALMTVKAKLLGSLAVVLATAFGVRWAMDPGDGAIVLPPASHRTGTALPEGVEGREPDAGRGDALPTLDSPEVLTLTAGAAVVAEPEGDALTGLVVDGTGVPLAGAEVRFAWHSNDATGLRGVSNNLNRTEALHAPPTEGALTDAEGHFVLHADLDMDVDWLSHTLLIVLHPEFVTRVHVNAPLAPGRSNDLGTVPMSPGANILGRLVDELGAPLAGVDVEQLESRPTAPTDVHSGGAMDPGHCRQAQRTLLRTRSGTDGRFELSGLAPGQVDLKIGRIDLSDTALRDLSVDARRPLDLGTWTLSRGRSISGVVRDQDGVPVERAEVYVLAHDAPNWSVARRSTEVPERLRGQTHTDADGRFRFGGLADAVFDLHAVAKGTAFTHVEDLEPGDTPLDVSLSPPGEILLHVEDAETGQPLPGVRLAIALPDMYEEVDYFNDVRLFGFTADDEKAPGQRRISGAGREGTKVYVRLDGYRQLVTVLPPVESGETLEYVARLEKALGLSGFVVDENDAPVPGVHVMTAIRRGSKERIGGAYDDTADDGSFTLDGIAGEWNIWLPHPGFRHVQVDALEVPRPSDEPYVIRLTRHATLEGIVRDVRGDPVAGASVVALPVRVDENAAPTDRWRNIPVALTAKQPTRPLVTQADESGTYRFLELTPIDWTLVATRTPDVITQAYAYAKGIPAELPNDAVAVHPPAGETTNLPLQLVAGSQVAGRITDDGEPVVSALVRLVPTPDGTQRWLRATETHTDAQGLYTLEAPVTGPAVVVASGAAGYPHWIPVDLLNGEEARADIDIAGATLTGRVVDATSHEPLASAEVRLSAHAKDGWWAPAYPGMDAGRTNRLIQEVVGHHIFVTTDDTGSFVARNLPPATYYTSAEATGHIRHQEHVTVPDDSDPQPVTVALPRAAIVTCTATTRDGTPVKYSFVEVRPRGEDRIAGRGYPEDGTWTIDPVDVGTWELRLVTWDDARTTLATEFVTVGAGDHETVEFVVD